jgi:hypothetical protein
LKASIEFGDVVLAQETIGRLQAADSAQPQLLRFALVSRYRARTATERKFAKNPLCLSQNSKC